MGVVNKALLAALLLLLGTGMLHAAKKELVIGVENLNYYPYCDFSQTEHRGFFKELMERFGKAEGYRIIFKPLPVRRLYTELLESGQIDFKFPDNPHWGGEYKAGKTVHYSEGVVLFVDGVLVRPEKAKGRVDGIIRLGTIAGFTPWTYMERIKAGTIQNVGVRSMDALLKTAMAGRVDGAYVNISVARYILDEVLEQPGELVWNKNLPYDKNHYFLSTVRHPGIVKEFNAFLKREAAMLKRLEQKYKIWAGE